MTKYCPTAIMTGIFTSLLFAAAVLSIGCEKSSSVAGQEFRIDPAQATIATGEVSVVLRVVGGSEPYLWHVTDETLGTVTGEGRIVTYRRLDTYASIDIVSGGVNAVVVTDANQWTATSIITHK